MPTEISELTYEEARDELVRVVAQLERGDGKLDDMMEQWQRGEALAEYCQAKLAAARGVLETASGGSADGVTSCAAPVRTGVSES